MAVCMSGLQPGSQVRASSSLTAGGADLEGGAGGSGSEDGSTGGDGGSGQTGDYTEESAIKAIEDYAAIVLQDCYDRDAVDAAVEEASQASADPEIDVVGVVEPGAEAACSTTQSGYIAVIATSGTIRGRAYERAILQRMPQQDHSGFPAYSARPLPAPMHSWSRHSQNPKPHRRPRHAPDP